MSKNQKRSRRCLNMDKKATRQRRAVRRKRIISEVGIYFSQKEIGKACQNKARCRPRRRRTFIERIFNSDDLSELFTQTDFDLDFDSMPTFDPFPGIVQFHSPFNLDIAPPLDVAPHSLFNSDILSLDVAPYYPLRSTRIELTSPIRIELTNPTSPTRIEQLVEENTIDKFPTRIKPASPATTSEPTNPTSPTRIEQLVEENTTDELIRSLKELKELLDKEYVQVTCIVFSSKSSFSNERVQVLVDRNTTLEKLARVALTKTENFKCYATTKKTIRMRMQNSNFFQDDLGEKVLGHTKCAIYC